MAQWTPDKTYIETSRAWKNNAMSQSPPSPSPVRRFMRGSSPSPSGSEGVAAKRHIQERREPDDMVDEDEDEAPSPPAVRSIQVIGSLPPKSMAAMESEEEVEGESDGEDQERAAPFAVPKAVQANASEPVPQTLTRVQELDATMQDEGDEEEEEEDDEGRDGERQEPAAMSQEIADDRSQLIGNARAQDEDVEADDDDEGDEEEEEHNAQVVASTTHVVVAPEALQQVVVHSPVRADTWAMLPSEVNGQWTVSRDVCSLNVGGHVMTLPRSIFDRLYGYQRQGVAWMWNLFQKGFGGCLADEMGLGKTVQVAAFLACLKHTNQGSKFLIVLPVTLMEQWRRELSTWAGDTGLVVHVLHGSAHERRAALRGLAAKGGVLVTSYDLLRIHTASLRSASISCRAASALLPKKRKAKRGVRDDDSPSEEDIVAPQVVSGGEDIPWDVVIVDEAHQIKNPSCVVGKDLRRLHSRSRFLLTGTPLQNKLIDMWAIMDLAQPGLLGNHATFERDFSEQIARGSKKGASAFAVDLKDQLAKELKRLTAPHFLRRLKDEVSFSSSSPASLAAPKAGAAPEELPPKTDVVLWLNLTLAQLELYELCLSSDVVRKATGPSSKTCGMEALRAIGMLKKLCNHPLLCLPPNEFNEWRARTVVSGAQVEAARTSAAAAARAAALLPNSRSDSVGSVAAVAEALLDGAETTQIAPECQHLLPRLQALVPSSVEGAALLSCKLRVLSVLLPQLQRRGHRCIIFSHSTRMLDLIQACVLRVLGLKFLRIDGTIDPKDRDLKLTKFHSPDSKYFCVCLSAQVGGVGLTITGADRVVLVDPAWNPAMDAQAIARAHRLGQQKEVVVYRLIAAGAIEDKMFRLQVFKRGLAKTAFEHEAQMRFFTQKELKAIFESPSSSASTQSLMAEQLGTEALEHEALLKTVAGDVGGTDDPQALAFWQSSDVLGFSDYEKMFAYLEQVKPEAEDAEGVSAKAREYSDRLRSEEYLKDQVVEGRCKVRCWESSKENVSPQAADATMPIGVLQDA